jgi:hypothetical protein
MRPWLIAAQSMEGGYEKRMEAACYHHRDNLDDRHFNLNLVFRPRAQHKHRINVASIDRIDCIN